MDPRTREENARGRPALALRGGLVEFEFYFGELTATDPSLLHYYRNRFALPRTLAALSILCLVPSSNRPVLDLACGFGPFGHYLTKRRFPSEVFGVDFNFYLVWGQKHWIAPRGMFVCADANRRLPFIDCAFSAVLCARDFAPDKRVRDHVGGRSASVIRSRVKQKFAFSDVRDGCDAHRASLF